MQAPELLRGGHASAAADTYAFGLVLWELLTWRLPWQGTEAWAMVEAVISGERPEVPAWRCAAGADSPTAAYHEAYCQLMR